MMLYKKFLDNQIMSLAIFPPSKNKDIKKIQQLANLRGMKIPVDGKWGKITEQAVKTIQEKGGNKFGKTKMRSIPHLSDLVVNISCMSGNKYPDTTKWIQQRLNELGYPVSKSGFFDKQTGDAISQLQQQIGEEKSSSIAPYVDNTWQALMDGRTRYIPKVKPGNIDKEYLSQNAKKLFVRDIETKREAWPRGNPKVDVWVSDAANRLSNPIILQRGSRGDRVKELQRMLNIAGYGPLKDDGIWGAKTDAEVSKYLNYYKNNIAEN